MDKIAGLIEGLPTVGGVDVSAIGNSVFGSFLTMWNVFVKFIGDFVRVCM